MATAVLPGLNFGPEVTYILAAILIITGLALGFYGHGLWTTVMSMIGALLGSAVGFLFGAALGGVVAGLVLALIGAVLVLIVVFGISYYFIDDIIGIVTAAIGGLLLALGLYLLNAGTLTAGLAGLGVFLLGALVQTATIKKRQRARTRAAATPP